MHGTIHIEPPLRSVGMMLHCEVCGTAVGDLDVAEYCLDCGRYVCAACWRPAQRQCIECLNDQRGPTGRKSSMLRARRADRRLREVIREAITSTAVTDASEVDDTGFQRATLRLKADRAAHAGRLAVSKLSMAIPPNRRLAARLQRSGVRAEAALRVHARTEPTPWPPHRRDILGCLRGP